MSQKTYGGSPYPIVWQNLHVPAMYFEVCVRHVLRCHLLTKNIAIAYGVTVVQEEVMFFPTYICFVSSFQVVSKSFDSIVVSVLLRMFMPVYSCYVRPVYSCVT